MLKNHRHASASFPRNARDARGERGHFARGTRHLPNNPLAQRSFYRRQTKKTKHAFHIVCFRFLLWPSISARHIALDETTMRASQGRTSKNAITAVMVSPFFIVNCPFLFWASSLFLRKIFHGVAKIFGTGIFCRGLYGSRGIATQSETKRKPLSNIAFTTS